MEKMFKTIILSDFYNHKFILDSDKRKEAAKILDNINEYGLFQPKYLPESATECFVKNIPFLFPDKDFDKYDSIQCEGQEIEIDLREYKNVHIIGAAVNNDFVYEELTLQNNNSGEEAVSDFILKDFYYIIGNTTTDYDKYYDCLCEEAFVAYDSMNNTIKRCLYYSKVNFEGNSNDVNKIILPYNPDLYILAITVEW